MGRKVTFSSRPTSRAGSQHERIAERTGAHRKREDGQSRKASHGWEGGQQSKEILCDFDCVLDCSKLCVRVMSEVLLFLQHSTTEISVPSSPAAGPSGYTKFSMKTFIFCVGFPYYHLIISTPSESLEWPPPQHMPHSTLHLGLCL